ncbi:hypothetical protein Gasu2_03250 [Galdieria sulphuraria]|uniref:Uncharacterized protein n=1 Tax=Galdieria sulphuraria TaxID=130081 RepID=M2Y091_GALSU|nr:uncharacterized protein Gasu_33150 [Galdieria sulphuraria]EME29308.1 hypothetical protein Gasu_33150 [Galdieria sulphuraria]GJD05877.1 hypothetical protein Gasu2_03250 [Galdieria sulphuraria]|eukprot:XP_005705828.1 hypothetical protein Gasu_33150 [Galdieria sulphuraria]
MERALKSSARLVPIRPKPIVPSKESETFSMQVVVTSWEGGCTYYIKGGGTYYSKGGVVVPSRTSNPMTKDEFFLLGTYSRDKLLPLFDRTLRSPEAH